MNCKKVEELLPLYVGRDLEAERARQVTEHVQTCTACAGSARAYAEASQLLKVFEPPRFSDAAFAAVRGNVLREIERAAHPSALIAFFMRLFQPRVIWAVSTAVLLGVCALAYYFIANRTNVQPYEQQAVEQSGGRKQKTPPEQATAVSQNDHSAETARHDPTGTAGVPPAPAADSRRSRLDPTISHSKWAGGSSTPAVLPGWGSRPPAVPATSTQYSQIETTGAALNTSVTSDKTLRLDIQTSDPNIRIIWFSHKPINEGSPTESSKGI